MPKYNKQNLDVKKTIETALDRTKGWLFGTYPSSVLQGRNVKIDVRYPGEDIPSSHNFIRCKHSDDDFDLSAQPVSVMIQSGKDRVLMKKCHFSDNTGNKKTAYVMSIHTENQYYRIVETPDGTIKDSGNHLLLWAIQKDKDFAPYISFFSKDKKENVCVSTQRLNLNKMAFHTQKIYY